MAGERPSSAKQSSRAWNERIFPRRIQRAIDSPLSFFLSSFSRRVYVTACVLRRSKRKKHTSRVRGLRTTVARSFRGAGISSESKTSVPHEEPRNGRLRARVLGTEKRVRGSVPFARTLVTFATFDIISRSTQSGGLSGRKKMRRKEGERKREILAPLIALRARRWPINVTAKRYSVSFELLNHRGEQLHRRYIKRMAVARSHTRTLSK